MQIRTSTCRLQQSAQHRGGAQQPPTKIITKLFMSSSVLTYEVEFPCARNNNVSLGCEVAALYPAI